MDLVCVAGEAKESLCRNCKVTFALGRFHKVFKSLWNLKL